MQPIAHPLVVPYTTTMLQPMDYRDSILNSSSYFHITEGLIPDIMHDCLEGCLQYEVKELLKHLFDARVIAIACTVSRHALSTETSHFLRNGTDANQLKWEL